MRKENIIIASRFLSQPITGVQRYSIEMSCGLKAESMNLPIKFVSPNKILHADIAAFLDVERYGFFNSYLWDQICLLKYLRKNQNPLVINFANTLPIFYKNKISVIHDIIFEKYPFSTSFFYRKFYHYIFPIMIKKSKHIITVSEFSKKELIKFYGIKESDISVVYNCVSNKFKRIETKYIDKYILAVSSMAYHKNFPNVIDAFLKIRTRNIKLLIVGGINKKIFGRKSFAFIKKIKENCNIKFLGYVKEEELIKLYSNAECLVYSSLYEGFGLPPLEAQACGCPIIVSNIPVFLEIYQDSAIYFNPLDINDIVNKIDLILGNKNLKIKLIEKGFLNVKKYSCENSVNKFINIIKGFV
jgi:glycosyltransferase involved in cell wall biosynthesis